MGYRRGFKSEASWYAREMRRELGVADYGPLCPWKLADHLGFTVIALEDLEFIAPEAVSYFETPRGQREFSAITLFEGYTRTIIHNHFHNRKRQAANISHELAHGLLNHPPKALFDAQGLWHYDPECKAEANWLGPALLVFDEAALLIVERNQDISVASDYYGASEEVVRMRINVSGAHMRVTRRRVA